MQNIILPKNQIILQKQKRYTFASIIFKIM